MAVLTKSDFRQARKKRIRKKISGNQTRPRVSVFRSARYIYAQLIDDLGAQTLCSASSLEAELKKSLKSTRSVDAAKEVGKLLAKRAKDKKIDRAVFDRSGYVYHGRVKAVAEGAREAGLNM